MRSLSGGYKMTNGSRERKLRLEEAIKESVACGREQLVNGNSQSMSTSRTVMANYSTNSMRINAMCDVFIVLFTFVAHF